MSWHITPVLADSGNHECNNCGRVWPFDQLKDIENLGERIFAGEIVPSGECPECKALCHPVKEETAKEESRKPVLHPYRLIVEKRGCVIIGEILVHAESPEQAEIQTREKFATGVLSAENVVWEDPADDNGEPIEIVDFDRNHYGSVFPE